MKFVQRDLGEAADISAGQKGRGKEFVKLVAWTLLLVLVIYLVVGLVVDLVVANISVATEKNLFAALTLLPPGKIIATSTPGKRAAAILQKLATHAEVPPLDYRLIVIDDKNPNAFAFPGGMVGVTSGLLEAMEDEIALAFVLGHELGHFKNRDHLRGLGRALGFSICYALIFGGNEGGELLGGNVLTLMDRKYSRSQEEAADAFGLRLVYDKYGKLEGTSRLFEILQDQEKYSRLTYMFSTHPAAADRIQRLKAYAAKLTPAGNNR